VKPQTKTMSRLEIPTLCRSSSLRERQIESKYASKNTNISTPSSASLKRDEVSLGTYKGPENVDMDGVIYFDDDVSDKSAKAPLKDDIKLSIKAPPSLSHALGTGRGLRLNPVLTNVAYRGGFSTVAGSSYATTIGVNPNLSSEWSSWTALYDECKVASATLYYSIAMAMNKQAPSDATAIMGLCYDPLNSGNLTTVATAAVHSQSQLYNLQQLNMYQTGSQIAYPAQSHGPMNSYGLGFNRFHMKMPRGASSSTNNVNVKTGQWFSTQDTATTSGYIKFFIENAATDIFYSVQYMLIFRVDLRSRS